MHWEVIVKIAQAVYKELKDTANAVSNEFGGLLGEYDDVIRYCCIDMGAEGTAACTYCPEIRLLEETLAIWESRNIVPAGLFHKHKANTEHTTADIEYIMQFMKSNPSLDSFYFPIVTLNDIFAYKAVKEKRKINIIREDVEII